MKYLISMEGSNGEPGNEYHNHIIVGEDDLKSQIREYLMPYIENNDIENEEALINEVVEKGHFLYERLGYGVYLEINIEEV